MRILVLSINYAPELTGIGKYTAEMAEWLALRGHEIRVVTSPPYYPEWRVHEPYASWQYKTEYLCGVMVWRCPTWVPLRPTALKRLVHLASFAFTSSVILFRQIFWQPEIVFVIEPPLFCAPSALICARLTGAKAWLHIQDFEIDAAFGLGIIKSRRVRGLIGCVESWLMKRFDLVSSISINMVLRLLKKGLPEVRTSLFPNWVDLNTIFPMQNPGSLRSELQISQSAVIALYSGNMGEKQGLEIVLEAADSLEGLSHIQFVLCGDGAARSRLEKQFQRLENVKWLPLQPPEKLNELLNMADIHLLPQRAEAEDLVMPSKLTGMLASGRPVIATAYQGSQLDTVVSQCGVVVQPGSSRQLADAIIELLEDPEKRSDLGRKARAYAEKCLGREQVLAQFEKELYKASKKN